MKTVTLRPLRALFLALVIGASVSCEPEDRCGDGVVDEGEQCDDGNGVSDDGCSASCQLDNNLALPGDERPGYFICQEYPLAAIGITCGPGTVCCVTNGPTCVSAEQGCVDVYNVVSCDGPEDCPRADYHCRTQSHGTSCTSSDGGGVWCHKDADCVDILPWLPDGVCTPSGICDFSTVTRTP